MVPAGTGFEMELLRLTRNVLTASGTGITGDLIAQLLASKSSSGAGNTAAGAPLGECCWWDARRTMALGTFSAAYTGAFQHYFFPQLNAVVGSPALRFVDQPRRHDPAAVLSRLLLDRAHFAQQDQSGTAIHAPQHPGATLAAAQLGLLAAVAVYTVSLRPGQHASGLLLRVRFGVERFAVALFFFVKLKFGDEYYCYSQASCCRGTTTGSRSATTTRTSVGGQRQTSNKTRW